MPTLQETQADFICQNVFPLLADATQITAAFARIEQQTLDLLAQGGHQESALAAWAKEAADYARPLSDAVHALMHSGLSGIEALSGAGGNWMLNRFNGEPLTDAQMQQIQDDLAVVQREMVSAQSQLALYRDIPPAPTREELLQRIRGRVATEV